MKKNLHPSTKINQFNCSSCKSEYNILTTCEKKILNIDICSNCHPFYLGKTNFAQVTSRSEKLQEKFNIGKTTPTNISKKEEKPRTKAKKTDLSTLF